MMKFLTMWQVWAGIAFAFLILLIAKGGNLSGLFPLLLILICPLMMLFMMGGKDHKH